MKYKDLVKKVEELEKIVKGEKPKDKITLQEFWDSDKKLAIHCDTEDKTKKLLQAFDIYGKRWRTNTRYTEWHPVGEVSYTNNNCFDFMHKTNDKVYEFEDVILPEEAKWTFTEDEKVILRNLPAEYKWIVRNKNSSVYVFSLNPVKDNDIDVWTCGLWGRFQEFGCYNHLFQTIKWEDDTACEFRKYI